MEFNIQDTDVLLVEREGILYRLPLEKLNYRYLTVGENDLLYNLEDKIQEVSAYLLNLSSALTSTPEEYDSISSLNELYETKENILKIPLSKALMTDEQIENIIQYRQIVAKDIVDDEWYGNNIDYTMAEADRMVDSYIEGVEV